LAFVTFGDGLQTIGERAFEGCYNIVEVKMPRNLGPSTVTGWSSSMMLKGARKKFGLGGFSGCVTHHRIVGILWVQ